MFAVMDLVPVKEEKVSVDKTVDLNMIGVSVGTASPAGVGLMATKPAGKAHWYVLC